MVEVLEVVQVLKCEVFPILLIVFEKKRGKEKRREGKDEKDPVVNKKLASPTTRLSCSATILMPSCLFLLFKEASRSRSPGPLAGLPACQRFPTLENVGLRELAACLLAFLSFLARFRFPGQGLSLLSLSRELGFLPACSLACFGFGAKRFCGLAGWSSAPIQGLKEGRKEGRKEGLYQTGTALTNVVR